MVKRNVCRVVLRIGSGVKMDVDVDFIARLAGKRHFVRLL